MGRYLNPDGTHDLDRARIARRRARLAARVQAMSWHPSQGPDVVVAARCADCGNSEMDSEGCQNIKGFCIRCCECEEHMTHQSGGSGSP